MNEGPWAGVDVGGRRKGFHLAVIEGDRVTELDHYPDAATLATPCGAPTARVVIPLCPEPVRDDPVHAFDLSELARI